MKNVLSTQMQNPEHSNLIKFKKNGSGLFTEEVARRGGIKRRVMRLLIGGPFLSLAKTKMTEVESKIADACDKMKGFEKKES
ncbi:hypothetical protein [Leptospira weilii]|uniref:hypothetical protein n=1 Tax=Leptospira weilii TaxID=28184 RepID=UPI0007739829|nr:hypothetical protein [Leptospira weilii]